MRRQGTLVEGRWLYGWRFVEGWTRPGGRTLTRDEDERQWAYYEEARHTLAGLEREDLLAEIGEGGEDCQLTHPLTQVLS